MQLDPAFLDRFAALGKAEPPSKKLSLLLRPAFIARPGKTFVWGDWSAIEARVLPWLAGSPGAEAMLDIFRTNDADPALPDIYKITAGELLGKDPKDVTKSERQSHGKVPCIAEGQRVLTDQGLVRIEAVTLDMRVWDGQSWVHHQGLVDKGVQDVYEYDGLVATADHVVWTREEGKCRFLDAACRSLRLVQSGASRQGLWVGDDRVSRAPVYEAELAYALRGDPLQRVWSGTVDVSVEPDARRIEGVSGVLATAPGASMAIETDGGCSAPLQQPPQPAMGAVRGSRHPVPVSQRAGCMSLDRGEPWSGSFPGDRSDRQRRALRPGQSALGNTLAAGLQPGAVDDRGVGLSTGRVAVRAEHSETKATRRLDARDYPRSSPVGGAREAQGLAVYRGKARVYDLVNAGPRHRFTVSGKLVSNCLSLGFGGGLGALQAMATNYGVYLDQETAQRMISGWRERNAWAKSFWGAHGREGSYGLWGAANSAIENPGDVRVAGAVAYAYDRSYLGGTLFCALPCGRQLVYPGIKWEWREVEDKVTKKVEDKYQLTYVKGYGRAATWYGKLAENVTQATAASILRRTLKKIEREVADWMPTVMHTHDEVVTECDEGDETTARSTLLEIMEENDAWDEGLPLKAEITAGLAYSKAGG